jgi:hypothetical protein
LPARRVRRSPVADFGLISSGFDFVSFMAKRVASYRRNGNAITRGSRCFQWPSVAAKLTRVAAGIK